MNQNQKQLLHNQLVQINDAFINLFNDYTSKQGSELLTKKKIGSLISQIFGILQQGSAQQRNQTKQILLVMFRDYILYFIDAYIAKPLRNIHNQHQLITLLLEKWKNFKKFVFFYYTILQYAHSHYQSMFKSYQSQGKSNKLESPNSVFPIPAIAMQYFHTFIYTKYRTHIHRQILEIFRIQRNQQQKNVFAEMKRYPQDIKNLFQIVYSCGLREMARISSYKNISNQVQHTFHCTNNQDINKQFAKEKKNPQKFFYDELHSQIIQEARKSYLEFYEQKLSKLSPIQDFTKVAQLIDIQKQKSQFYFFTNLQKKRYQENLNKALILTDLSHRLTRQNSFKFYFQQYNYHTDDYLPQIKLFMRAVFKQKKQTLPIIQDIITNYLKENGDRVGQKINKRREYIQDIIELKKSVNTVIEQTMEKQLKICLARDKCFRKILDSIEASRNLAQYADFKIKQCIKGKLSQQDTFHKIKDIFIILQNLAATDSFLLYHQQLLSKRLLEGVNQPKIEVELFILKQLAQKLGTVSVSQHMNMIKDIQYSQELTEKYHKQLPFSGMRWGCRIISPPFWPDNLNKSRLDIALPEAVRMHAETVANMFHQSHQNRYLQWRTDKGYSLFQGKFPKGKFRFQAQNLFMSLLFHIDESKNRQLLYGNLRQKVKISKQSDNMFLMKCVAVLMQNNLIKLNSGIPQIGSIKNLSISEGDTLSINIDYIPKEGTKPNQTIIVKISPQMHKAMHQTSVENNKIIKQRQKIVQAVLVKLLKHSHSVGSNNMTFQQLYHGIKEHHHLKNFNFTEGVVKLRLQELIHRGYCERDEIDKKIYHYVA